MIHPLDWRDVSFTHKPPRFGKITVVVFLAIANLSTVAMAQNTSAPITPGPDIISPTTSPKPPVQETLAPFVPIAPPPTTNSPTTTITNRPTTTITTSPITAGPTKAPTPPPAPLVPTLSPTVTPSFRPSYSNVPSSLPSIEPTNYPTSSHGPSGVPSNSAAPTIPPSTAFPTLSPTPPPSISPVFAPTSSPSSNGTLFIRRECNQVLEVETPEKFAEVQVMIYQLLMQSYTAKFDCMVEPQIVTRCEVINQELAGGRRWLGRLLQTRKTLLIIKFTMQYETSYGYDVDDCPRMFQTYINSNLERVAADMRSRFLPVKNAEEVILFNTNKPTTSPSLIGGNQFPSTSPTAEENCYSREYHQRLTVSVPQTFDMDQVAKFQYLYQQYTENFRYEVSDPQIFSECLVLSQQIGVNSVRGARARMFHVRDLSLDFFSSILRRGDDDGKHSENDNSHDSSRQLQSSSSSTPTSTGYPLTMRFTMQYGARVGVYDISTYNQKFAVYINSHLTKVVEDLTLLGLPVVSAGDLLLLQDKGPTKKPTMVPTTPLPTKRPVTMSPTGGPTMSPISTEGPTMLPSEMPSDGDSPLIEVDVTEGSFKLGLGLGLGGAFMISALALLYYRHMEKKRPRYGNGQEKDHQPNQPNQQTNHGSMDGYHTNHHGSAVDTHMEMGNDSPSTIELTPNDDNHADDRMNRSEHHIHHSELALHGEVNRSRSLDAMDAGQQASGTPQRSVRSGGPSTSQPQPRSGSFVYTTGEPFGGGEIMDSIFAPTQSTSPSASNNAAGYNDMFATTLPDHREGFAVVASVHHDHHPSMNHHMNDLMINDASFSSDSEADNNNHHDTMLDIMDDEIYNPSLFDGSRDELDNYKNQDLETLRTMIEEEIDEMEGMMSLAMTRALTEPEDASMESLPWAGAQDNGSIEASCLCETYDWWKRCDEKSSLDSINEYFQDILNRIVITVMFGMTSPLQGAQIVHGCAAILGLDLLKQLPVTTLVITGMRKTNDLAQGHNFIVKAFKTFGTIEEAAIAPNNRGFGFVRFAKPESVQRALKKYREFEIEIQDVSVSIKTLKSERPR
mmetsp:Transcript_18139/g.32851  ORF Transcript_18139/g.32851 Transcript_18139/m.32851 type:complete len:1071 (-) Transcript_18139:185-3397(-)